MTATANVPKHTSALAVLEPYCVEKPSPLLDRRTIQLLIGREILDYTILRTEETRELNTVLTPRTHDDDAPFERVAFLATKQKGAESRAFEQLLRSLNAEHKRTAKECYLKAKLCCECPRCVLFGATNTEAGGRDKGANIKHRISYATAFSLEGADDIGIDHTFNGVDEATSRTGQTLNVRTSVLPGKLFASIVTLRSVTKRELLLALKTILSTTRYGAETRIGGEVRNTLLGVTAGWEETLTPLELSLALTAPVDPKAPAPEATTATVEAVARDFAKLATFREKVKVLSAAEVDVLVDELQGTVIDKALIDAAYKDVEEFRKFQNTKLKKEGKE